MANLDSSRLIFWKWSWGGWNFVPNKQVFIWMWISTGAVNSYLAGAIEAQLLTEQEELLKYKNMQKITNSLENNKIQKKPIRLWDLETTRVKNADLSLLFSKYNCSSDRVEIAHLFLPLLSRFFYSRPSNVTLKCWIEMVTMALGWNYESLYPLMPSEATRN